MSYALAADIQAEFKDIDFDSETAISLTDVDSFLEQEEAVLNGLLSTIYAVPVTGDMSEAICKMLLILMVKSRIVAILEVKTGGKTPDQGDPESKMLYDKAMGIIEKLQKKDMLLPDASLVTSAGAVRSYTAENEITATFEKETDQW